jgi:thymidine kinase
VSISKKSLGGITIICGSMFSGKTEELIRLVRRAMHARKRVQVFKSSVDTRCETTFIRTHDDTRFTAIAVPDSRTLQSLLEPDVQVIGIEEIQFFDEGIVPLCQRLADQGIQVIAAGLDQDFRGLPFSFMPTLMAVADSVMKLHAICKVCGEEASRTQRLVDGRPAGWDEPTILIGADESYEARCRRCHRIRNVPRAYRIHPNEERRSSEERDSKPGRRVSAVKAGRNGVSPTESANGRDNTVFFAENDDGTQLGMFPEIDTDTDS